MCCANQCNLLSVHCFLMLLSNAPYEDKQGIMEEEVLDSVPPGHSSPKIIQTSPKVKKHFNDICCRRWCLVSASCVTGKTWRYYREAELGVWPTESIGDSSFVFIENLTLYCACKAHLVSKWWDVPYLSFLLWDFTMRLKTLSPLVNLCMVSNQPWWCRMVELNQNAAWIYK